MTVQLRLCRRHGGRWRGYKYNRWSDTGTRCLVCEWQRRERKNLEWGGVKVPYELQVDPRTHQWPDGWQTLEEHPSLDGAVSAMDQLQAAFPHAKLRVVNVVRVTEQKEEAT